MTIIATHIFLLLLDLFDIFRPLLPFWSGLFVTHWASFWLQRTQSHLSHFDPPNQYLCRYVIPMWVGLGPPIIGCHVVCLLSFIPHDCLYILLPFKRGPVVDYYHVLQPISSSSLSLSLTFCKKLRSSILVRFFYSSAGFQVKSWCLLFNLLLEISYHFCCEQYTPYMSEKNPYTKATPLGIENLKLVFIIKSRIPMSVI